MSKADLVTDRKPHAPLGGEEPFFAASRPAGPHPEAQQDPWGLPGSPPLVCERPLPPRLSPSAKEHI